MTVFDLIQEIRCRDMRIEVVDGQIQLGPKSAITPDLRQAVIQNKHQILVYLVRQGLASLNIYNNPPECHNPFTPHQEHELPRECDPESCDCYRLFGYPHLCQGAPCRWVWPASSIEKTR